MRPGFDQLAQWSGEPVLTGAAPTERQVQRGVFLCLGDSPTCGYDVNSPEKGSPSDSSNGKSIITPVCVAMILGYALDQKVSAHPVITMLFLMGGSRVDIRRYSPGIEANMDTAHGETAQVHISGHALMESGRLRRQGRAWMWTGINMLADHHLASSPGPEGSKTVDFYVVLQKSPHYADGNIPISPRSRLMCHFGEMRRQNWQTSRNCFHMSCECLHLGETPMTNPLPCMLLVISRFV